MLLGLAYKPCMLFFNRAAEEETEIGDDGWEACGLKESITSTDLVPHTCKKII